MMTNERSCPSCGKPVPGNSPGGLCPLCLLGQGLGDVDSGIGEATPKPKSSAVMPPNRSQVDPAYAITTPSRRLNQLLPLEDLQHLFPQLEILELIGQGGMGSVYKARQTKLDRIVAVKVIRPEVSEDPAFAERFMREARTLARLQHPNIVGVHDFGEIELRSRAGSLAPQTICYFVMEYIDGVNVRQLIQSKSLSPQLIYSIIDQTCDALQYAHEQSVVHRDIKPENLLVDSRGRVKIADFGLAKLADGSVDDFTLTGTHQVMGTPSYMAPEQIMKSRDVDHRADIYSLGVVLYEMLTGSIPLGRFAPASSKAGSDLRLDDIIHQALATEPDQRFANISLFRQKLTSIVSRQPAHVRQSPATKQPSEHSESAAHGFSTILDREVAGVWRMVGGAAHAESGNRLRFPILSMFALCLVGGASLLAPWFEYSVADTASAAIENATITAVGSPTVLHGYQLNSGRILVVAFGLLALSLGVTSDRNRASVFAGGACSFLAVLAVLLCFASYGEARQLHSREMSSDRIPLINKEPNSPDAPARPPVPQTAIRSDAADSYVLCVMQDAEEPADLSQEQISSETSFAVNSGNFSILPYFLLPASISICLLILSIALLRQSILMDLSPLGETTQGGDTVTLNIDQLPLLPEICAVCGEHGGAHVHRKLNYQPQWAVALSIAGFILGGLPGLFILLLTSKESRISFPVCEQHKHHGRRLILFASMGWLIPILTAGLGVVLMHFTIGDYAAAAGIPIGLALGLIFYILPIIYMNVTSVKCEQTASHTVTFSRVAAPFSRATREAVHLR